MFTYPPWSTLISSLSRSSYALKMADPLVNMAPSPPGTPLPDAFVTLITSSAYLPGALALLHALHELHPAPRNFKVVCLVTPETVDAGSIGALRNAGYDLVIGVEPIASGTKGRSGLHLMGKSSTVFPALTSRPPRSRSSPHKAAHLPSRVHV